MSPIPLGILAVAGAAAGGAYELIESNILTSSASSVTFSSIPQDYKHLQIRWVMQSTRTTTDSIRVRLNGDTGNNYAAHFLNGRGSSVVSSAQTNQAQMSFIAGSSSYSGWTAGVSDLLDYSNSSKNTTMRTFHGLADSAAWRVELASGLWMNTAAVDSVSFTPLVGPDIVAGSRFSLYGLRG